MSHVDVRTEPASHQAVCATCGWHTVPLVNEKRAKTFAEQHREVCPNPPPPRNGALLDCGCWCYAMPGTVAGQSIEQCPEHGSAGVVACNVPAPTPDPGSRFVVQTGADEEDGDE